MQQSCWSCCCSQRMLSVATCTGPMLLLAALHSYCMQLTVQACDGLPPAAGCCKAYSSSSSSSNSGMAAVVASGSAPAVGDAADQVPTGFLLDGRQLTFRRAWLEGQKGHIHVHGWTCSPSGKRPVRPLALLRSSVRSCMLALERTSHHSWDVRDRCFDWHAGIRSLLRRTLWSEC